jgi:hypothetical protein
VDPGTDVSQNLQIVRVASPAGLHRGVTNAGGAGGCGCPSNTSNRGGCDYGRY